MHGVIEFSLASPKIDACHSNVQEVSRDAGMLMRSDMIKFNALMQLMSMNMYISSVGTHRLGRPLHPQEYALGLYVYL